MQYAIPRTPQELAHLRHYSVSEELLTVAIAGVIHCARQEGRPVDSLIAEVLAEDGILNHGQREALGELLSQAWGLLPSLPTPVPTVKPSVPALGSALHNTAAAPVPSR